MVREAIEQVLAAVVLALGGMLATYLSVWVGRVLKAIERKAQVDINDKLESCFQETVKFAVLAINQTMVDGLKKEGSFGRKEAEEALRRAKAIISRRLAELGILRPEHDIEAAVEACVARISMLKKN